MKILVAGGRVLLVQIRVNIYQAIELFENLGF
jgi:hypothetical protein